MKTLIVTGGQINLDFLSQYVKEEEFNYIIGVDKGIEACYKCDMIPSVLMGDFDSLNSDLLNYYEENTSIEIQRFNPIKDDTDTQMAIKWAVEKKSTQIVVIGGIGSRIDHLLGNIQCLTIALEKDIDCCMIDEHNKIMLIKRPYQIKKSEQYGDYLSLLAFTDVVTKLTLKGVKYPLYEHTLTNRQGGFGVSNEIINDYATIQFESGIIIMIQSKD